MTNDVI